MSGRKFAISVVIPAYNAERFIRRAVDGVLRQTCPAQEIIVVDDGSTDGTAEVVRQFGAKVRYLHQANAGVSVARNTGIQAAQGEWIAFLDADDEWYPEKLRLQTELLQRHPDLAWVAGNYDTSLAAENRRTAYWRPEFLRGMLAEGDYFSNYFEAFTEGVMVWTSTLLIRKAVMIDVGGFELSQRHGEEDIDMWWRIARRQPAIGFVAEPIAVYHLDNQVSLTHKSKPVVVFINFIERQHGMASSGFYVQDCLARLLRMWIRGMLFENRGADIRLLVRRFGGLLPAWYRGWMWLLTVSPSLTNQLCRAISGLVRGLHLRRRVVSPPPKL